MEHTFRLAIGDWSKDGHEKCEFVRFRCNRDVAAIRAAYLKACKKAKVTMHSDGRTRGILCDYEDRKIPLPAKAKLEAVGVDFGRVGGLEENGSWVDLTPESVAVLFLEMARTQMPGFEYELADEPEVPCVNGFWQKGFNFSIGYGVFG